MFAFSRNATGALILILAFVLVGMAYVGSTFFTRELQLDHIRDLQKQMRLELQELRVKDLRLEQRMMEIATHVENLEDSSE